jgi:ankyrin repeat protein
MSRFQVKIEPAHLKIGEVPLDDTGVGTVTFTNTADEPRRLINSQSSCGCTASDFPKGKVLEPGETVDIHVNMKAGKVPRTINKTVTFMIEGQDPIVMPVSAEAVSYVIANPTRLDPATSEPTVVLSSRDDTPFVITSMSPPIIEEFGEEAATEHEIALDWDAWREMGSRPKLMFYLDHPKCVRLYVDVRAPRTAVTRNNTKDGRAIDLTAAATEGPQRADQTDALRSAVSVERMIRGGQTELLADQINNGEIEVETIDRAGNTVLALASKYGQVDLMVAAVDAGADLESPGQLGRTPIMFAAESGNTEAVQLLLDEGVDVSARDQIGGTALTWAASMGNAESVQLLIDAGSDVDATGHFTGWTPLIWASLSGKADSVTVLLEAGAPVNVADQIEGATPLMHAVRTGHDGVARQLLESGAELEAQDRVGRTALLMAASTSGATADTVRMLAASGADLAAKDRRGLNALELARKRTDPRAADVVATLQELMEQPAGDDN